MCQEPAVTQDVALKEFSDKMRNKFIQFTKMLNETIERTIRAGNPVLDDVLLRNLRIS